MVNVNTREKLIDQHINNTGNTTVALTPKQGEEDFPKMEVTGKYKCLLWTFQFMCGFHVGYAMAYTNQTASLIDAKFGWDKDESTLYQSMIGSFAVGAMMFGSSLSGWLIVIGRAKVLRIAAFIGIIGVTLTLFINIYMILAGRLMYGFSTGMIAVAMPRYMEECVPPKLVSVFGGLYCFTFAQATILAYFLAYFLP